MNSYRARFIVVLASLLAFTISIPPFAQAIGRSGNPAVFQDEKRNAAMAARQKADDLVEQGTPEALKEAAINFEQAAQLFEELKDVRSAATHRLLAGQVYLSLEEPRKALMLAEKALDLLTQERTGRTAAFAYSMAGTAHFNLSEFDKALEAYGQEMGIWEKLGEKAMQCLALYNLGLTSSSLGDRERALTYYNKAIELVKYLEDRKQQAGLFGNVADLYIEMGYPLYADGFLQVAADIYRSIGETARS